MENLFSVNQLAFILKVHPLTVRRYIKMGKLNAVRVGGSVRIKESDLQAFIKALDATSSEASPFIRKKTPVVSPFSQDDPLLRLEGRGASVQSRPFKA